MSFKMTESANVDNYISAKILGAVTDADIGKTVKLATTVPDSYELCANNDHIEGFITGLDPMTQDGVKFGTIQVTGMKRVEAGSAGIVIGGYVAATAQTAPGIIPTAGVTPVRSVAVPTYLHKWRAVSANTATGAVTLNDTDLILQRV